MGRIDDYLARVIPERVEDFNQEIHTCIRMDDQHMRSIGVVVFPATGYMRHEVGRKTDMGEIEHVRFTTWESALQAYKDAKHVRMLH